LLDVCISHIEIKRKLNYLIVNIFLGKSGMGSLVNSNKIFSLRSELSILLSSKFAKRELTINLVEVVDPDTNSKFLSEFVKEQLERRVPFRKVIKSTLLKAQKAGVKGVKVQISGRLNGAEIARTEWVREGQVPLHNLKANIDYFNNTARMILT
jgi:small subunit ribosomal protein S3